MNGFLRVATLGLSIVTSLNSFAQTNGWLVRKSPVNEHLYAAAHGNGTFVVVGNHQTILSSPEGLTWTVRRHKPLTSDNSLNAVTFAENTFVAVGGGGDQILTSSNGTKWSVTRTGPQELSGVAHGNGRFVAVGQGPIFYSSDGREWLRATNLDATFKAVAFGNNTFVAVGEDGAVATSPGGRRWTRQSIAFPANTTLEAIVFNGTEFIASARELVDTTELIHSYSTPDGVTWGEAPPPPFYINAYAMGNEGLLGVGDNGQGDGRTQISPDGRTWPGDPLQISRPLSGATFGEGRYLAVGRRGMILQTRPALDTINFDLSRDFSVASNPNGVWSYGYERLLGTDFTLFTHPTIISQSNGAIVDVWNIDDTVPVPAVLHNESTETAHSNAGQATFPPGAVWFFPGASTNEGGAGNLRFGVIRVTIPEGAGGNYTLRTVVQSPYNAAIAGDSDFHVLLDGSQIFRKSLSGTESTAFSDQLSLAPGDTIDFAIGRGADNRSRGSALRISASLVQVP